MDYATANNRAAKAAQKQKAAAAPQKRRAVPARDAAQARCRPSAARQAAGSPAGHAAHAFLKCRFLPHFTGKGIAAAPQQERDFFSSFAQLCAHYGISPMDTRHLGYPYSMEVALWDAERMLRTACEPSVEISADTEDGYSLTAKETYCTGNTLYYIPVVPLHYLMRSRTTRKSAQLLLGVCAYLYHVAGVPYYRNNESYLRWQYEMIGEWTEDDPEGWEQEYYWQNRSQLHKAAHIGDVMHRRLMHGFHPERLSVFANAFTPLDLLGSSSLDLAHDALSLWQDFPQAHLWQHADESILPDPEAYDAADCIMMEKYIGFCSDTTGWLYDTLSECVNNEFNECAAIQEPVLHRTFDGRQQSGSLEYECRLLRLINGLCELLNDVNDGNQ